MNDVIRPGVSKVKCIIFGRMYNQELWLLMKCDVELIIIF